MIKFSNLLLRICFSELFVGINCLTLGSLEKQSRTSACMQVINFGKKSQGIEAKDWEECTWEAGRMSLAVVLISLT